MKKRKKKENPAALGLVKRETAQTHSKVPQSYTQWIEVLRALLNPFLLFRQAAKSNSFDIHKTSSSPVAVLPVVASEMQERTAVNSESVWGVKSWTNCQGVRSAPNRPFSCGASTSCSI